MKAARAALLAGAAAAWSPSGLAQSHGGAYGGAYFGGAVGQAHYQRACRNLSSSSSCDETDAIWRILGGYRINRNVSVELAYTNLGGLSTSSAGVDQSQKAAAWEAVGIAAYPLPERFAAYGKAGLYRAKATGRGSAGLSASGANTDFTFGVGIEHHLDRHLGFRLEWQRYSDLGGGDLTALDVDTFSFGVLWKF